MKTSWKQKAGGRRMCWSGVALTIRWSVILWAGTCLAVRASENEPTDQWNIMVVPGNQTAFSGQARQLFNNNCARCHSQDGRAQTLVARQRHVQDLSECRLTDEQIIQQILQGTHDKTVSFKMPPFKEKLSSAEIESLVPLVKAFRPMPSSQETAATGNPRLVGIINPDYVPFAIFEATDSTSRQFILRENESHEGVALLKISPKTGTVKIKLRGKVPVITLALSGHGDAPRGKGISGWFRRLELALADAPRKVVLSQASLDVVLFLYSQFTGRTLLCSPRLPSATFDLDVLACDSDQAAQRLTRALAAKGITTLEDGDKFILVVPTSEAGAPKPHTPEIKSLTWNNNRSELFPRGAFINFPNTDLGQFIQFYAELTGRTLDPTQTQPSNQAVNFTTQTALSADECLYAFDVLLGWHGLKATPTVGDSIKFDPIQP
jgi:mono/diheme cytochrome c family protein